MSIPNFDFLRFFDIFLTFFRFAQMHSKIFSAFYPNSDFLRL